MGFHPCITAITQLAGTYALGILVVLCAYAGYTVTASILEVCPDAQTCPSGAKFVNIVCGRTDLALPYAQRACTETTQDCQGVRRSPLHCRADWT